jgi:hypothetical protein
MRLIHRIRLSPAAAAAILLLFTNLPIAHAQSTPAPSAAPASAAPDDTQTPAANPGRPTISNPARIPPVGYLQFEQGINQASGSPGLGGQFGPVQSIRFSVHPRLMLEFASQPVAVSTTTPPNGLETDPGDLTAGVQGILTDRGGRTPAVAVSYIGRVRSGTAPDIDVGSFSQSAILLISGDLAGFHYDTNYLVQEQSADPIRRAQFGQTLSVTHTIFPARTHNNLSLTGEMWHFTQPLVDTTRDGLPSPRSNAVGTLWALGYSVRKNFVLDAGFDRGLTSTSTAWQGFAGFTYLLPHRLWKPRTSN